VTTRPLRLAYFDGSSAAKVMSSGVMDTQDIVIWGRVRPDMARKDRVRIQELCKWGERFKLDGFVRYLFNYFPSLDVFTHVELTSGWRWICERHPSRVSSRLADL
jgi:hypothetical protein